MGTTIPPVTSEYERQAGTERELFDAPGGTSP